MTFGSAARPANSTRAGHSQPRTPPGPAGYPVVGVLPRIWRDPLRFFQEVALRYGGLARVGVGRFRLFLVSDPELIREILHDPRDNYWKGSGLAAARTVMGRGLATSDGSLWQRQHRMIQPAFTRRGLAPLLPLIRDTTREELERWRLRYGDGRAFDVCEETHRLTLRVVCRALFGATLSAGETDVVCRSVVLGSRFIDHNAWRLLPVPDWAPTPRNLAFKRAMRNLDDLVYGMIEQRRRSGERRADVLGWLLEARDEATGERMSTEQLRDEIATLLIAGHETPANGIAWTHYLLGRHPDVAARLETELDGLGGGALDLDSLDAIPFTEQVVKESLRLYPPAWVIVRTPREDVVLNGYSVPAGTPLLISQYVVHRHPLYWERPEEFDPDRWTPERAVTQLRYQYLPFGGGQRICIGHILGMLLMKLVVAMTARAFRLELSGGRKVAPLPLTTLRPKRGIRMRVRSVRERPAQDAGRDADAPTL